MNTQKYKNQFKISSNRLSTWDYSSSGWYFVTICVKDRKCVLGNVEERKIVLSKCGEIVRDEWFQSENIRHNITMDEFIVMPNHIHGIIIINDTVETSRRDVCTNNQRLFRNSLGAIIGQIKSISTKRIRQFDPNFAWQPRFFDHVIRNETSLEKIREYIRFNPLKWNVDIENPKNVKNTQK